MAQITTFNVTAAGGAPTPRQAAAADTAEVGDGLALLVTNTDASPHTATLAVPGKQVGGADNSAVPYTVAATTGSQYIRLHDYYADPTDGLAHISYDATPAGLKVAVVRV